MTTYYLMYLNVERTAYDENEIICRDPNENPFVQFSAKVFGGAPLVYSILVAFTAQLDVVRWFKQRKSQLSNIEVEAYSVSDRSELEEPLALYTGQARVDNIDEFELKMLYNKDGRGVPVWVAGDDLMEDYAMTDFLNEIHSVGGDLTKLVPFVRHDAVGGLSEAWFNLCKFTWDLNFDAISRSWQDKSKLVDKTSLLINYIEREEMDYYADH